MTQAKANLRKLRRARYVPPRTVKKSIANTERVVSKAITGCGVFRDIPQVKINLIETRKILQIELALSIANLSEANPIEIRKKSKALTDNYLQPQKSELHYEKNDDLITLPSHNSHALDYIIKKAFTPRKTKTSTATHNVYSYNKEESTLNFQKIGEAIFFGTDLVIKLKPNISASGELFICQKD
ncbi:hypothetical protein ACRYKZ_23960 [Escherichia coli]